MAYIYDFSKPRVRINGKAQDKFSIAHHLDFILHWRSLPWTHMEDAFSYNELANELKRAVYCA